MRVWECKVVVDGDLPQGADSPMRDAVAAVVAELGVEHVATFSGWGGELSIPEQAVLDETVPPDDYWQEWAARREDEANTPWETVEFRRRQQAS